MTLKSKLLKIGLPLATVAALGSVVAGKGIKDVHDNHYDSPSWVQSADIYIGKQGSAVIEDAKDLYEGALTATINKLNDISGHTREMYGEIKQSNDALNTDVTRTENEIALCEGANESLRTKIGETSQLLSNQRKTITGLESEISVLERENESLAEGIPIQRDTIAELQKAAEKPDYHFSPDNFSDTDGDESLDSYVVGSGDRFCDIFGALKYDNSDLTLEDVEIVRNGNVLENPDYNVIWPEDIVRVKSQQVVEDVGPEKIPLNEVNTADLDGDGRINTDDLGLFMEWYQGNPNADFTDKGNIEGVEVNLWDLYELADRFGEEDLINSSNTPFAEIFNEYIAEKDTQAEESVEEQPLIDLDGVTVGVGLRDYGKGVITGNVDYAFDNGLGIGAGVGARIGENGPREPLVFSVRPSYGNEFLRGGLSLGTVTENNEDHPRHLGDKETSPVVAGFVQFKPFDNLGWEVEIGKKYDGEYSDNYAGIGLNWSFGGSERKMPRAPRPVVSEGLDLERTEPDSLESVAADTVGIAAPADTLAHAELTNGVYEDIQGYIDDLQETKEELERLTDELAQKPVESAQEPVGSPRREGDTLIYTVTPRLKYNAADPIDQIDYRDYGKWLRDHGEDLTDFGEIGGQEINKYDFWEKLIRNGEDVYRDGTSQEDTKFVEGFDDYRTNIRPNLK